MENTPAEYKHIKGWGIDADPKNDPTYPMKKRTDEEQKGYSWKRPPQQPIDIEVLHSIERPNVTAVFGSTLPPSGLSGMIRRWAFKHSENDYSHWLPLILADRVNEVEGILDDITKGSFPNFFVEKGLKADWRFNRTSLLTKVAIGAAITAATVDMIRRR